jgi:RNA polymerase sigma-70 factor (ECF subfamily)
VTKEQQIELIDTYTDALYSWAYYKVKIKSDAEDLTQETLLKAIEKIDSFKGKSSIKTWLFTILNNKIYDYFRAKIRKNTISLDDDNFFEIEGHWKKEYLPSASNFEFENLLDNENFINVFNNCLKNLKDLNRFVIEYKFLQQRNTEEICNELGITQSNYWQLIHRTKVKLRNCLDNNWFKSNV